MEKMKLVSLASIVVLFLRLELEQQMTQNYISHDARVVVLIAVTSLAIDCLFLQMPSVVLASLFGLSFFEVAPWIVERFAADKKVVGIVISIDHSFAEQYQSFLE